MLATILVSATLSFASVGWKMLCTGPTYDARGASPWDIERFGTQFCYSDQLALWAARGLAAHVFPYEGTYTADGQLTGGVVEYPVMSGFFLWLVGLPADTDRQFVLFSGIALATVAVAVAVLLYAMVGRRAFLWSAAPALAMYVAYNVDVLPVLASVVGFALLTWSGGRLSPAARAYLAAIAFGIGGALKIYPLMFALPVALWLAYRTDGGRPPKLRWGSLFGVLGTAAGTVVLCNLPFALWQREGWLASFAFQSARRVENNTMAIWWWFPHMLGYDVAPHTALMTSVAGIATAIAFAVAVAWGWSVARRSGEYPWLEVSGALLVAFMVLGKVHSPQYILWLIPLLVLIRVRTLIVLAYFVVDIVMFYGIWRPFYLVPAGLDTQAVEVLTEVAVILRALLLAWFYIDFLRRAARPSASTVHRPVVHEDLESSDRAEEGAGDALQR